MLLTLLAQENNSGGSSLLGLAPFLLIAVAMYFLLIRPQRRRMQEQRALAAAVQEGDEVLTTAGVYGFVTAIEDDIIWLEIAEGVDIRIARAAVSRRITATESADADDSPSTTPDAAGEEEAQKGD